MDTLTSSQFIDGVFLGIGKKLNGMPFNLGLVNKESGEDITISADFVLESQEPVTFGYREGLVLAVPIGGVKKEWFVFLGKADGDDIYKGPSRNLMMFKSDEQGKERFRDEKLKMPVDFGNISYNLMARLDDPLSYSVMHSIGEDRICSQLKTLSNELLEAIIRTPEYVAKEYVDHCRGDLSRDVLGKAIGKSALYGADSVPDLVDAVRNLMIEC